MTINNKDIYRDLGNIKQSFGGAVQGYRPGPVNIGRWIAFHVGYP